MFVYPSRLRTQSIISIIAIAIYLVYYLTRQVDRAVFEKDMSALARTEIAASPEVVRKVFLDFPNWSKIGDPVIRSITQLSPTSPLASGSQIKGNFAGTMVVLTVTENTPQTFSWKGNIAHILTESRTFSFLPSEQTKGHTTFVQEERFVGLFWALVASGVMREQRAFEAFNEKFRVRVEGVVKEGGI